MAGPSSTRRLAVRVTPDALRHVRAGHPWVFADSIVSVTDGGSVGDLAVIFDDRRRFAAIGLYDPSSPIRIRVLHHGSPCTIDDVWWQDRIGRAAARRAGLADDAAAGITTGYRVVHGENDGLPGVVLDRYADVAVLKLYTAALLPHLPWIVAGVEHAVAPSGVVVRLARAVQRHPSIDVHDGDVVAGALRESPVMFRENGLWFEADVVHGQKTGHFLDQRENRALVRTLARGRRVLDVFSCSGGFAVHAAAGGATEVHCVDASGPAIAAGRRNTEHNVGDPSVAACGHRGIVGGAFAVLDQLARHGERYDLVVVDPPSFAQAARDTPAAVRAYERLATLAVGVVRPGGTLVQASCSSRVTPEQFEAAVRRGIETGGGRLHLRTRRGHPADHPIGFPQGEYLKAIVAEVESRRSTSAAGRR